MSRGNNHNHNIKPAKRYVPPNASAPATTKPNSNRAQPSQQETETETVTETEMEQSPNELVLDASAKRTLDMLMKARSQRSEYLVLEPNTTYRLQFNPSKISIEKKTFNGIPTERIAYTVINTDDPDRLEKKLSLSWKQSKPLEEILAKSWTVMDVTKTGEGFSLTYKIDPIE